MIPLIASIFALGIGPLIYQTFGPMRRTDRIVSGFILVVIAGTLLFEVLPETFEVIGYFSITLMLIGFAGPTVIEKLFAKSANKTHMLTIVLGIIGLVLHASIDGAALFDTHSSRHHENLSLAIILHRLPVGLTIWWLLKPLIGERYALATIICMAIATAGGYALSMQLSDYHQSAAFVALQAFIAGSLLHVVLHKPHEDGCLHTSKTHELKHAHHSHTEQAPEQREHSVLVDWRLIFASKIRQHTPDNWESLGMTIGAITLLILHLTF